MCCFPKLLKEGLCSFPDNVFSTSSKQNTVVVLRYNTTLLPSVSTIALGMFRGAKYTHHTCMPIIKRH